MKKTKLRFKVRNWFFKSYKYLVQTQIYLTLEVLVWYLSWIRDKILEPKVAKKTIEYNKL